MRFGTRLREERLRRHLSQEELAEVLALSARSIRRWEQGQTLPQPSVRLQLCRFFGLRPEELFEDQEASIPRTPLWCVPYPRNPFFTGRDELLTSLHTSLYTDQEETFTHPYALHGLGGVGKTQIALEYIYRFSQTYRAVFWIGAETAESLALSLLQLAETLQLPERDDKDQQRIITAVRNWLTEHDQWLLICDNVEDLGMLDHILPFAQHGTVLLTTRRQVLGTRARSIPLLPMGHEEGLLFLLRRARVLEAEATPEHVHQLAGQQPTQHAAATELVVLMGDCLWRSIRRGPTWKRRGAACPPIWSFSVLSVLLFSSSEARGRGHRITRCQFRSRSRSLSPRRPNATQRYETFCVSVHCCSRKRSLKSSFARGASILEQCWRWHAATRWNGIGLLPSRVPIPCSRARLKHRRSQSTNWCRRCSWIA
ncbi:helix-turn-helix domain-containing protein [Ktedonospora formicarum]|uniref:helix-turn-helix domain-containing protein n=1 Tax=Ktedonospora formicarum TaxID=2778364 RepID=UPI001F2A2A43|nr:helix-turn-helix domain-containing protein [Ktedonospora formicarum]